MHLNGTPQQPPKDTECPVCTAELSPPEYEVQQCWSCGWAADAPGAHSGDG